jgi:hypothetical protein
MPDKKVAKTEAKPEPVDVEEEEPATFDKWDHRQVKNAIDDTVKEVVKKQLGETSEECFALVDKRLWMAFFSCLLCGFACLYDYLYPYPASHYFMIGCIVPYAIIMAYLTYFMMYVEGAIILTMKKGENKFHVASKIGRFDGLYTLSISKNDANETEEEFSIGKVVTEDNQVCEDAVATIVKKLMKID